MLRYMALSFILISPIFVYSEHKPDLAWMAPYKGVGNISCCSTLDCRPAVVALVPLPAQAGHVWVSVDGVVMEVPVKAVHESETTEAYWCYRADMQSEITMHDGRAHFSSPPVSLEKTRCVFYATGW
jgi:hypothetical protein